MLRRAFPISRSSVPGSETCGQLRSWWRRLFAPPREDVRHLPPYLLRDIGLATHEPPDRFRDRR